jgi:hypothetical protein
MMPDYEHSISEIEQSMLDLQVYSEWALELSRMI